MRHQFILKDYNAQHMIKAINKSMTKKKLEKYCSIKERNRDNEQTVNNKYKV